MNFTGTKKSTVFSKPIPKIPGLSEPVTAADLLADATITKPEEIISGWLHKGTKAAIASVSKAGKTFLGLDLAFSITTGTDFWNQPTKLGKVLFLNTELQPAFIKERLAVLKKHRNVDPGANLVIWNVRGMTANAEALIQNIIREVEGKGYDLIILDGVYKLMVGSSEGAGSSVGVLLNQLERLAERSGAAVLYTHHFPKGNVKNRSVIDRLAGSGVFARDADTILTLTPHEMPDCYTVEMVLRNFPHQPAFVVQFQYPVMVVREDLDPEDVEVDDDGHIDTDEGVMALLEPGPLRSGEWQAAALEIGVSRPVFYRIKAKLKSEGLVKFVPVTKTWSLPQVVEVSPAETSETPETKTKLIGWPSAGASGDAAMPLED